MSCGSITNILLRLYVRVQISYVCSVFSCNIIWARRIYEVGVYYAVDFHFSTLGYEGLTPFSLLIHVCFMVI
jgi:hypothetical protein